MGYYDYLRELLRPLRLYDLDSGAGGAELKSIGRALDRVCMGLEETEREAIPSTASGFGLDSYEELMPFVPAYSHSAERSSAICALMRIDDLGFTLRALNATVEGCGIGAVIEESGEAMTVNVSIINTRGVPEDFTFIKERIEQILPCHLDVKYSFIYSTWNELMGFIESWEELMASVPDWQELEIYTEL